MEKGVPIYGKSVDDMWCGMRYIIMKYIFFDEHTMFIKSKNKRIHEAVSFKIQGPFSLIVK
jgi:hypothetical protein